MTELINTIVAKLDGSSSVVSALGEKDIVQGQQGNAAFHGQLSDFEDGYRCATSKNNSITKTAVTLRGEGFCFLEKRGEGGYQETSLSSACERVGKCILHISKENGEALGLQ